MAQTKLKKQTKKTLFRPTWKHWRQFVSVVLHRSLATSPVCPPSQCIRCIYCISQHAPAHPLPRTHSPPSAKMEGCYEEMNTTKSVIVWWKALPRPPGVAVSQSVKIQHQWGGGRPFSICCILRRTFSLIYLLYFLQQILGKKTQAPPPLRAPPLYSKWAGL